MLWDIFCRVIDNHGDTGVCWRLTAQLVERGHQVRLWVDDRSALAWMAPGALNNQWPGVRVMAWEHAEHTESVSPLPRSDVWIEAFGCDIPEAFVAHYAPAPAQPAWINLEYLSAESYVERSHALPSPVMHGPAQGWIKHFFYPGFTTKTGGLLREPGACLPLPEDAKANFLRKIGVMVDDAFTVSLFCYEPKMLSNLLQHLSTKGRPTRLLVTSGRARDAVRSLVGEESHCGSLQLHYLPLLSQPDYDTLLQCADLNFVRGEDSLLRGLWAGKPFVWHIYPQDDGAHVAKLQAFMQQMQWSPAVQKLYLGWNGLLEGTQAADSLQVLEQASFAQWQMQTAAARSRMLEMPDLLTQLLLFVTKNR